MPRIIGAPQNEVIFEDHISGSNLGMYFRMPTTKERQGYLNMAVQRSGNKVTLHHAEARMKYGARILVGLRDGDFIRMKDGQEAAMSSNPASPDYHPQWKEEMETGCADLIVALAGHVFDGSARVPQPAEEAGPEEDEDLAGE